METSTFFSATDLLSAFLWLIIILLIANNRTQKQDEKIRSYYLWNVVYKLFFSLVFALIYILYYGGGDTTAYWDGANCLNNLLINNPGMLVSELFSEPSLKMMYAHFDDNTGYPPGWIYREPSAWFLCKISFFLSLITFKSYIAATFIVSFIVANSTWAIFKSIINNDLVSSKKLAFAFLFFPSLNFWCTGLSKDSFMLLSSFFIISIFFNLFSKKKKLSISILLFLGLYIYIIYSVRPFLIACLVGGLSIAYGTILIKQFKDNLLVKLFLRFSSFLIIVLGLFFFLRSGYAADMLKEAAVLQQDFTNNELYTGKRYEINTSDYSFTGALKTFPNATLTAFYRPFIYEAFSFTLFLNGLESSILIFFTITFLFKGSVLKKINIIRKNEFLIFALIFAIFIGFMAGFSSILFGLLVRIRAPLLPFLFLLLSVNTKQTSEL